MKPLFEQTDGVYCQAGDYFIPNITLFNGKISLLVYGDVAFEVSERTSHRKS